MMINGIQRFNPTNMLLNNQLKPDKQKNSPLEKQKTNIQNQIQQIKDDKTLSPEEKMSKIQALQENLDGINEQLGQKELEEIKNSGQKIAEKMQEDVEKEDNTVRKEEKAQVAMNYGLISASREISNQSLLTAQRKKAVLKEGEDSEKVKRIDGMLEQSRKVASSNMHLAAKAAEEYAKTKKVNEDSEFEEKRIDKKEQNQAPEQEGNRGELQAKLQSDGDFNVNERSVNGQNHIEEKKIPAAKTKTAKPTSHTEIKENLHTEASPKNDD